MSKTQIRKYKLIRNNVVLTFKISTCTNMQGQFATKLAELVSPYVLNVVLTFKTPMCTNMQGQFVTKLSELVSHYVLNL